MKNNFFLRFNKIPMLFVLNCDFIMYLLDVINVHISVTFYKHITTNKRVGNELSKSIKVAKGLRCCSSPTFVKKFLKEAFWEQCIQWRFHIPIFRPRLNEMKPIEKLPFCFIPGRSTTPSQTLKNNALMIDTFLQQFSAKYKISPLTFHLGITFRHPLAFHLYQYHYNPKVEILQMTHFFKTITLFSFV